MLQALNWRAMHAHTIIISLALTACTSEKIEDTGTEVDTGDSHDDTATEDTATEDTATEDTAEPPAPDYDCGDDSVYDKEPIGQWRICLSVDLKNNDSTTSDQALALLESDLLKIEGLLNEAIVDRLQLVRIWVERDVPQFPGGVYHPSAGWLSNNGYPEYWAEGVQIGNAENYLSWTAIQPAMMLHELSHAWHHQVLGYGQAEIQAAFDAAMASGMYDSVAYAGGGMQQAYAATNVQEYFAELTEAYFWENDFYPFVRSELESFDSQGFEAVVNAWQPVD